MLYYIILILNFILRLECSRKSIGDNAITLFQCAQNQLNGPCFCTESADILQIKCLPRVIIAGAQKSGTTVLASLLAMHPNIVFSPKKEVHFFDRTKEYSKGMSRYLESFPFVNYTLGQDPPLFGEATPFYIASRYACERIVHHLPDNVKFIVLLREPISRAYSEYQMKLRRVVEQNTFLELLRQHASTLRSCLLSKANGKDRIALSPLFVTILRKCTDLKLRSHNSWDKLEKGLLRLYNETAVTPCNSDHRSRLLSLVQKAFIPVGYVNSSLSLNALHGGFSYHVGVGLGDALSGGISRSPLVYNSHYLEYIKDAIQYELNLTILPRLTSEKVRPLAEAFLKELAEFKTCAENTGHYNMSAESFTRAVEKCIDVQPGISTQYLYRSMYVAQLHRCIQHIPREHLLVIPAEKLQIDVKLVTQQIYTFLGVHDIVPIPALDVSNNSTDGNNNSTAILHGLISHYFPRFEAVSGWKLKSSYDKLPTYIYDELKPFFGMHNRLLAEYMNTTEFNSYWEQSGRK